MIESYIILAAGFYLLFQMAVIEAKNFISKLIFKVPCVFFGITLIIIAAKQLEWI